MTNNEATTVRESFAIGLDAGLGSKPAPWKGIFVSNLAFFVSLLFLPLMAVGMPWQGWALAVGAWVLNRLANLLTLQYTKTLPVTMAVGASGITMMFRIWIIAAGFFLVGSPKVGDQREWALWGMGIFLVLITVDIGTRVFQEMQRRVAEEAITSETPVEEPAQ